MCSLSEQQPNVSWKGNRMACIMKPTDHHQAFLHGHMTKSCPSPIHFSPTWIQSNHLVRNVPSCYLPFPYVKKFIFLPHSKFLMYFFSCNRFISFRASPWRVNPCRAINIFCCAIHKASNITEKPVPIFEKLYQERNRDWQEYFQISSVIGIDETLHYKFHFH